jgi:hypothetical protein
MDLKTALNEAKPKLSLPAAGYPARKQTPAQAPSVAAKEAPKQTTKVLEPLAGAEKLFAGAMKAGADITVTFFDGAIMVATPIEVARYVLVVRDFDGVEHAIFKSALRSISRVAAK